MTRAPGNKYYFTQKKKIHEIVFFILSLFNNHQRKLFTGVGRQRKLLLDRVKYKIILDNTHTHTQTHISIYKFGLSVLMFVCLFVSNKRQNG